MEYKKFTTSMFKDIFDGDEIKDKYLEFMSWYIMQPINKDALYFLNNGLTWEDIKTDIHIEDDGRVIYEYEDDQQQIQQKVLECPTLQTFALLFNNYSDNHVASSDETFKLHFANILDTYYKEYENTKKAIDNLMNLNENDISTDYATVLNIANIPEKKGSTDEEEVDFITQQQKTIQKKGKLQINKELLSSKRAYTTRTFLNRFKHLFITIISPDYTLLYED